MKNYFRFCLLLGFGLVLAMAMPTFQTAVIACFLIALIAYVIL